MAQLKVNLSKIKYNAYILNTLLKQHHIHFTPVLKCVAGDRKIVETLKSVGLTHFADARINNIFSSKEYIQSIQLLNWKRRQRHNTIAQ